MRKFYAHSLDGMPVDEWHLLDEHLKGTAELAKIRLFKVGMAGGIVA